MGKRSNFARNPRDYYITPQKAVEPLLNYLEGNNDVISYCEPCAGNGALINWLRGFNCVARYDISPEDESIKLLDMFSLVDEDLCGANYIITNPPWDRAILHPMIEKFLSMGISMWLLFDADWCHTKQSVKYMKNCEVIISVGRIKWFNNTTGKDNCAWYKFVPTNVKHTKFIGR